MAQQRASTSIRLKDLDPGPSRKDLLWSIIGQNELKVHKLKATYNGFVAIMNDEARNLMVQDHITKQLSDNKFSLAIPPEMSSERTIVIRNLDDGIGKYSNKEKQRLL